GPPGAPGQNSFTTTTAAGPQAEASATPTTAAVTSNVTVQFATADAAAVDAGMAALRSIAGVRSAVSTSIAIGGTSVMRVTYAGEIDALAAALRAQGCARVRRRDRICRRSLFRW
ncbi:MAG: hypothetical protein V4521_13050, partial [Pseudomonadota bacterium]